MYATASFGGMHPQKPGDVATMRWQLHSFVDRSHENPQHEVDPFWIPQFWVAMRSGDSLSCHLERCIACLRCVQYEFHPPKHRRFPQRFSVAPKRWSLGASSVLKLRHPHRRRLGNIERNVGGSIWCGQIHNVKVEHMPPPPKNTTDSSKRVYDSMIYLAQ